MYGIVNMYSRAVANGCWPSAGKCDTSVDVALELLGTVGCRG